MYGICRARTDAVRGMLESGLGSSFPGGLSHRNGMGRGSRERKRAGKGLGMGMGLRPGRPSGTAFFWGRSLFPRSQLAAASRRYYQRKLVSPCFVTDDFSPPFFFLPSFGGRSSWAEPGAAAGARMRGQGLPAAPLRACGQQLGKKGRKKNKKNRSSSLLTAQIISS